MTFVSSVEAPIYISSEEEEEVMPVVISDVTETAEPICISSDEEGVMPVVISDDYETDDDDDDFIIIIIDSDWRGHKSTYLLTY